MAMRGMLLLALGLCLFEVICAATSMPAQASTSPVDARLANANDVLILITDEQLAGKDYSSLQQTLELKLKNSASKVKDATQEIKAQDPDQDATQYPAAGHLSEQQYPDAPQLDSSSGKYYPEPSSSGYGPAIKEDDVQYKAEKDSHETNQVKYKYEKFYERQDLEMSHDATQKFKVVEFKKPHDSYESREDDSKPPAAGSYPGDQHNTHKPEESPDQAEPDHSYKPEETTYKHEEEPYNHKPDLEKEDHNGHRQQDESHEHEKEQSHKHEKEEAHGHEKEESHGYEQEEPYYHEKQQQEAPYAPQYPHSEGQQETHEQHKAQYKPESDSSAERDGHWAHEHADDYKPDYSKDEHEHKPEQDHYKEEQQHKHEPDYHKDEREQKHEPDYGKDMHNSYEPHYSEHSDADQKEHYHQPHNSANWGDYGSPHEQHHPYNEGPAAHDVHEPPYEPHYVYQHIQAPHELSAEVPKEPAEHAESSAGSSDVESATDASMPADEAVDKAAPGPLALEQEDEGPESSSERDEGSSKAAAPEPVLKRTSVDGSVSIAAVQQKGKAALLSAADRRASLFQI